MEPSKYSPQPKFEFCRDSTHRNGLTSLSCLLMASVAILVFSATSASALTNFLANPGFELGTSGWTIVPPWTWNGPSYAVQDTNQLVNTSPTVHVAVHGGTNAFKVWGYFQTYGTTPGAMQTLPAAASSQWSSDLPSPVSYLHIGGHRHHFRNRHLALPAGNRWRGRHKPYRAAGHRLCAP